MDIVVFFLDIDVLIIFIVGGNRDKIFVGYIELFFVIVGIELWILEEGMVLFFIVNSVVEVFLVIDIVVLFLGVVIVVVFVSEDNFFFLLGMCVIVIFIVEGVFIVEWLWVVEGLLDIVFIFFDGGVVLFFIVLKLEKVFVGVCNVVWVKKLLVVLIILDDCLFFFIWWVMFVVCVKDVLLEFIFEVFFGLFRDSKNVM